MTAEKIADTNPKDLKKYGLDNPKSIVEATFSDGKKVTFYLGSETPITSTYYLMKKRRPKSLCCVDKPRRKLYCKTSEAFECQNTRNRYAKYTYVKLVRKGQPTIEIKKVDEKNKEDNEWKYYVRLWNLVQPYSQPVESQAISFQSSLKMFQTSVLKTL